MASYGIGDFVWFKRAGSTPFASGDPSASKTTYDNELGGRGPSTVTFTKSSAGIGSDMGVPQIKNADLIAGLTSEDMSVGTGPTSGLTGASFQSSANVTDGFADLSAKTFIFTINGVTVTTTFAAATTTVAGVLTQVQAAIAAAKAAVTFTNPGSPGKFTLASVGTGSNVSLSIGLGTANATLNFTASKSIQSSANVTDPLADQNGNTFIFTIDGTNVTTTFSGATTTVAGIVSQVTARIAALGVSATFTGTSGGKLTLTSTAKDPTKLTIGNGSSNAVLNFTNATTTNSVIGGGTTASLNAGAQAVGSFGVKSTSGKNHIGAVSTNGIYDGTTPTALVNPGSVGGLTVDSAAIGKGNTIRTLDPNFPSGRPKAAVSDGPAGLKDGPNILANDTIDIATASKIADKRIQSGEQGRGRVVDVVIVTAAGTKSPDGTKLAVGDKMYMVDWGIPNPSNPRKAKWRNQVRASLHAESDLVAA